MDAGGSILVMERESQDHSTPWCAGSSGSIRRTSSLLVEYAFGESLLPALLEPEGLFKVASPDRFGVFVRGGHRFRPLRYHSRRTAGRGHRPRGMAVPRAGYWEWTPPSGQDGLVVLVHAPGRGHAGDGSRRMFFRRVADAVRRREVKTGHKRSIVAGDFNAHPFDPAVVAADGLHAIGTPTIGAAGRRTVTAAGVRFDYFYNPMWSAYGSWDGPRGNPVADPPAGGGTYYRLRNTAYELGWHMLDQVVIRPGESGRFPAVGPSDRDRSGPNPAVGRRRSAGPRDGVRPPPGGVPMESVGEAKCLPDYGRRSPPRNRGCDRCCTKPASGVGFQD